jgi:hypothetical protein
MFNTINKKIIARALMLSTLIACESNDSRVFDVSLEKLGENYKVKFLPNMNFNNVPSDSVHFYHTKEDMYRIMSSDIKKGDRLLKTDDFSLYVFLFENFKNGTARYQLMLRTYDSNMKFINEIPLASTIEKPEFSGYVSTDATVTRVSINGKSDMYSITEDGRFISLEDKDE